MDPSRPVIDKILGKVNCVQLYVLLFYYRRKQKCYAQYIILAELIDVLH